MTIDNYAIDVIIKIYINHKKEESQWNKKRIMKSWMQK